MKTSTYQKLGFQTNVATKSDMIFQLKSAVEDGILAIKDKRILREMKNYRRAELQTRGGKDPNATRHFDLLIATAIAWAMRNHAKSKSEVPSNYKESLPNPAR